MFKTKITLDNITIGSHSPTEDEVDELAQELIKQGYRRTSNAYCLVSRIDKEDWLEILSDSMKCTVARFYKRDGTGVPDGWRDHYIRCFSKDTHTVHPLVIRKIPPYIGSL